jgi:hypothetical protein
MSREAYGMESLRDYFIPDGRSGTIGRGTETGAPFTLQHVLACEKGGLTIFNHNENRDELVNLAG